MDQAPYIPDLDDADFRRLIDARKMVLIKFWSPRAPSGEMDTDFAQAATRHPEVAFAQSNVDEHHNLMLRTQAHDIPTLQAWVDGNLFGSIPGVSPAEDIDEFIAKMLQHRKELRAQTRGA